MGPETNAIRYMGQAKIIIINKTGTKIVKEHMESDDANASPL